MKHPRKLSVGEKVYFTQCPDCLCSIHSINDNDKAKEIILDGEDDEENTIIRLYSPKSTYIACAADVYKIDERLSILNNTIVCIEHIEDIEYPYYLPERDENFYGFELKTE